MSHELGLRLNIYFLQITISHLVYQPSLSCNSKYFVIYFDFFFEMFMWHILNFPTFESLDYIFVSKLIAFQLESEVFILSTYKL